MTIEYTLAAQKPLEFAFGKVTPGKEAWMFGEYFPQYAPIFSEFGLEQIGTFRVKETNVEGVVPDMGSFNSWPSAKNRADLHVDPRFAPVLPTRDAALDLLSDGHLFQSIDEVIVMKTDQDYLVVIGDDDHLPSNPIFSLPLRDDSANSDFAGKSISLKPWEDADVKWIGKSQNEVHSFRIQLNPAP